MHVTDRLVILITLHLKPLWLVSTSVCISIIKVKISIFTQSMFSVRYIIVAVVWHMQAQLQVVGHHHQLLH